MIDRVINQIENYKIETGKKAKRLYLGHTTKMELIRELIPLASARIDLDNRISFYGIPIYEVDEEEFIDVG